jgi:hypothetical protein
MATVNMTSGSSLHLRGDQYSAKPYLVEREINLATVATTKGSAIAQGDVIEVIKVPAGSLVLAAGFEVTSVMTGTSTDATLDFGITGGDVDSFVDGFDLDGASVGAYSAIPSGTIGGKYLVTTADTLDLLVVTQTGTITGGKLRVWAVLMDVTGRDNPGLAQAGV